MSLEKLKQQIQEGALSGVYAFCGAEDYLKRHYIDLIRRKLVPDPEDPLNFVRLYYREATAAQVLDFAFGLPVFAEKKLLLLELLDTDAPAAALTDAFETLRADFPDSCVIILNEQQTDSPSKKSALQELVRAAKGHVLTVKFDERPQDELTRWVGRHAKAAGKAMDRQVIQHLLSVADHGMRGLVDYVLVHTPVPLRPESPATDRFNAVTGADVDSVTVRTVESRIYDLADALLKDDAGGAVDVLRELLERYPDTMVFDTVYGTFARLYRVSAAAAAGLAPDDIASALGMKPYAVKKNLTLSRRVPPAALRRALRERRGRGATILISQRLHTIRGADQILVLDDGAVCGLGDHDTLCATCPAYREICQTQLETEEAGA